MKGKPKRVKIAEARAAQERKRRQAKEAGRMRIDTVKVDRNVYRVYRKVREERPVHGQFSETAMERFEDCRKILENPGLCPHNPAERRLARGLLKEAFAKELCEDFAKELQINLGPTRNVENMMNWVNHNFGAIAERYGFIGNERIGNAVIRAFYDSAKASQTDLRPFLETLEKGHTGIFHYLARIRRPGSY